MAEANLLRELENECTDYYTYLEPFVLFYDPSGDHVVVGVLVSRAQVNRLPAIRLKRLFEYIL